MEVTGKLKLINETQTFGSSGFRKRECVVTTDEQYPQMLQIEFIQDKCDLLNTFNVGDNVKISINLRGREWIDPQGVAKYFNTIQGWRVEKINDNVANQNTSSNSTDFQDEEPDNLPF